MGGLRCFVLLSAPPVRRSSHRPGCTIRPNVKVGGGYRPDTVPGYGGTNDDHDLRGVLTVAKISFLGLGLMGAPMAQRLLEAGHDLTVWNRTREKADGLARSGAHVADSPAEAAAEAEGNITMLSTPQVVEEVIFGDDAVAES